MAVVRINPPNIAAATPGNIVSISVVDDNGDTQVYVPNATTGVITTTAKAATHLVQMWRRFIIVTG